jgi:hypothetical protein
MPKAPLPNVPTKPWTDHIANLRAGGMTAVAIADAANLPLPTVYAVAAGRLPYVFGYTAQQLATVTVPIAGAPHGHEFATGSVRRARALARIGHSQKALRSKIGFGSRPFFCMIDGRSKYVSVEHAEGIRDVYDVWSEYDGDSKRTRTWAIKAGWHGPEAWTATSIDDPAALPLAADVEPDDVLVQTVVAAVSAELRKDEYRADYRLRECGRDIDQAAIVVALAARGVSLTAMERRLFVGRKRLESLLAQVAA